MTPAQYDRLIDHYRARDARWKAFVEFIAVCRSEGTQHIAKAAQDKLREMKD